MVREKTLIQSSLMEDEIRIPPLQYLNKKSEEDFIPTD